MKPTVVNLEMDIYSTTKRNSTTAQAAETTQSMTIMKVLDYTEAPSRQFDADTVRGVTGRVVIGKDDHADNFCMRVFTVAPGGFTPRHSHDWEHEIFIHSGKGQVFRDGEWQTVTSGTVVFIPGGEEHQFMNAGAEEFVFICLIPSGVSEL